MPYIELETNLNLDSEIKNEIKSKLGELISILPGKSETYLMVKILDSLDLYFQGNKKEALICKINLYGNSVNKNSLDEFTLKLTNYLSNYLNIDANRIYISYFLSPYWGEGGINF